MKRLAAGAVLAGLLALGGCTQTEQAEVREDVQGIRQEAQEAARGVRNAAEEAALAGKVKSALLTRKGLDARAVDVEVDGSRVVLKGDVPSPEQAAQAEQVARDTRGVTEVENQLTMRVPATTAPRPTAPSTTVPGRTTPSTIAPPSAAPSTTTPPPAPPPGYRKTN